MPAARVTVVIPVIRRRLVVLRSNIRLSFFSSSSSTTTLAAEGKSRSTNNITSEDPVATTKTNDCKTDIKSNRSRLGIGGSNLLLAPSSLEQYASILQTALTNNITTFELSSIDDDCVSGSGEQQAFCKALEVARRNLFEQQQRTTTAVNEKKGNTSTTAAASTVLARFGYRTTTKTANTTEETAADNNAQKPLFSNDVLVGTSSSSSNSSKNSNDKEPESAITGTSSVDEKHSTLLHNISQEYINFCLSQSPLVKLKDEYGINLIYLVHNPETQGGSAAGTISTDEAEPLSPIRTAVRDRLKQAFIALEEATSTNKISSYGVCSNGLSLPNTHPLHLPWKDVIEVAYEAASTVHKNAPNLTTIQLPANLLEIKGFAVAQQIQEYANTLNLPIDIFISRPLTCFPDQGVGTGGYPFKLLDYQINVMDNANAVGTNMPLSWTNEISEGLIQSQYLPAYNAAMGHFDAESILEVQRERPLTVEERETVQGCRLLQQMLYDLDKSLQHTKSFHEYEDNLHTNVIPLIHSAFEELDETSTDLLQQFFMAHGAAVRVSLLHLFHVFFVVVV